MTETTRKLMAIPIIIIVLGLAWLMMAAHWGEDIDWVQAAALALVALVSWLLSGIDKVTVVVIPWFLLASVCSLLHDTGTLDINLIVPVLTVAFGCLVLLALLLKVPRPTFMTDDDARKDS